MKGASRGLDLSLGASGNVLRLSSPRRLHRVWDDSCDSLHDSLVTAYLGEGEQREHADQHQRQSQQRAIAVKQ